MVGRGGLVLRNIGDSLSKKEYRYLPFEPTTLTLHFARAKSDLSRGRRSRKFCVIGVARVSPSPSLLKCTIYERQSRRGGSRLAGNKIH